MSADPIIYCLERLTDYRQFERLASDLMAGTDYPGIEPIGGTGDGGRDALHVHRTDGTTTIFAYSVRIDWETKLRDDCKRIAELEQAPNVVVFVSTQRIDALHKDSMRAELLKRYGWATEYYDLERIRTLLVGHLKSLLGNHPAIFVSPWFERRGGELITHIQRDLILIDHLPTNYAFASWLFRRLSAAGYSVWCHGLAPLAGENADASVRLLIRQRAARYLPVLSAASITDQNLRSRVTVALTEPDRTLPCWTSDLSRESFDSQLAAITPARFDVSWAHGLSSLSEQLIHGSVKTPLTGDVGRRIALEAYQQERLLQAIPERVYANVFRATVPAAILVYELTDAEVGLDPVLGQRWAHVRRGKWLFSFLSAPQGLPLADPKPFQYSWRDYAARYDLKSQDLIKMLVKRSLFVACCRIGFNWCDERFSFYLPEETPRRHGYQHVDGVYTNVSFTGERSWGSGEHKSKFHYQLGPVFRVSCDEEGLVWVTLRFYVRVTDTKGHPFDVKLIPSRRKRVTKSWWNRQWLQRTLGMMQFIAGNSADINGQIVVGDGAQAVRVAVTPLSWECPVSIDVEALDRMGDFQEELATARAKDDEGNAAVGEASDG